MFDETLKPVADASEYEEEYEDAGLNVPDNQIDGTRRSQAGITAAPDLPSTRGFGAGVVGPLKMEAPGCSGHDMYRNLQTMSRGGRNRVVSRGVAYRMCGVAGAYGWGWRHIASEHKRDRGNLGILFGKSWDSFAMWAITGIVGSPSGVVYQSGNKTYRYQAPIQLWKNGKLVTTYMPRVIVARTTWRIITAYPSH